MRILETKRLLCFMLVTIMLLTGCAASGSPDAASQPPSPDAASAGPPPEAVKYAGDWPLPNKDLGNTRSTNDTPINSSNVRDLGVAWMYRLYANSTSGAVSTNPLILNGNVYFQDLLDNVYALDLEFGEPAWIQSRSRPNIGPNGVAVGWNKVFACADPYSIAAMDIESGNQTWLKKVSDNPTVGIDIQPVTFGNMVYVSTVPGTSVENFYAGGGNGTIYVLDQETGEIQWSFDTVDSKDIWGNAEVNSGGGCSYPPAIDEETGLMFWGTANPAPFPGTSMFPNGSSRPGPNLYTNSMLALDHSQGKLLWYNQVWPHGLYGWGLEAPPILATADIDGKPRDLVIGGGKIGQVYAFDRKTGEQLWETPVGTHGNDTFKAFPANTTTTAMPGNLGGIVSPMAYAEGVMYVPAVNHAVEYTPSSHRPAPQGNATGAIAAVRVADGKVLWEEKFTSPDTGGATVINDLVFTATLDGMIYALQKDTGEQIWSYQAPAGINGSPAVSGKYIVWPCGVEGAPSLIAFQLGFHEPAIYITYPENNSRVKAGPLTIKTAVFNFKLVDKIGQKNAPGEGHIIFYNNVDPPLKPGRPALTANGTYAATANASYTWPDVQPRPGGNTFWVQLVNNDNTPLPQPAIDASSVSARKLPAVVIESPAKGSVLTAGPIAVSVKVLNFKLVHKFGEANVLGEGHLIYYLDVTIPTTANQTALTAPGTYYVSANTTYVWPDVKPGKHTFGVQAVNNDNTPVSPAAAYAVEVTVNMAK